MIDFISKFKTYFLLSLLFSAISVSFYLSNKYYNNKIDKINTDFILYKEQLDSNIKEQEILFLKENEKLLLKNEETSSKLKKLEDELYVKFKEQNNKNNDILKSINNGSTRLFVDTKKTTTGDSSDKTTSSEPTTSLVDGVTERRELDTKVAEDIIKLTIEGDLYKNQLKSLQDWLKNNY